MPVYMYNIIDQIIMVLKKARISQLTVNAIAVGELRQLNFSVALSNLFRILC